MGLPHQEVVGNNHAGVTARLPFCSSLPKIELHAHLNGSIRDSTIRELALKKGEGWNEEDIYALTDGTERSLPECFKLFDLIHRVTTEHDTITRITQEVLLDFESDNVAYIEIRTTPKNNEAAQMTKRSYVEAVLRGMEGYLHSGEKPGMMARLLLSVDRRESIEEGMKTLDLAQDFASQGVVGVDLSGNPSVGSWDTFGPVMQEAKRREIRVTLHCAEVQNEEESSSMLQIHPDRIGHGCTLSEAQIDVLSQHQIPVELCLTSNVRTNSVPDQDYSQHHFKDMALKNVPIILCTDDSGVFRTTLSREYALAAVAFDLTDAELFDLAEKSVDHTFAEPKVQEVLRSQYKSARLKCKQ